MNFYSAHPIQHKVGLIKGLADRAVLLSHPEYREKNLQLIKETLSQNSYPLDFVNGLIKERVFELFHPVLVQKKKEKIAKKRGPINWRNMVVLRYINNISINIKRIFSKVGIHTVLLLFKIKSRY